MRGMGLFEGVRLALIQIVAQKLKSAFALIGVTVGVMFLIVVVSVVEGMDQYITEDFSSQVFGVNTITLRRIPSVNIDFGGSSARSRARRQPLTRDDWQAIEEQLAVGARVGLENMGGGEVDGDRGTKVTNVSLRGVSANLFEIRNLQLERGRVFSPQEEQRGVPVVVLGYSTADALFPNLDPIGRTIRIRGFPFRIIGVLEEQGSVLGFSRDNMVLAPASSPIKDFVSPRGQADQIVIQTLDPDSLRVAQTEVEGIMRVRHQLRPGDPNDFSLETAEEALSVWEEISSMLFLALPMLVGISLVVGGMVIMNIMLVSVMERTREIGVRKAVGARRSDILTQVLVEAGTISGLGALIGVAIGGLLAALVEAMSPLPAAVTPFWASFGVGLGVLVGMISGVYPAIRASKLDPIDALRYE